MSSGIVSLTKDDANLVGISIGGGAPLCPHVYIVQVFDNTPAALDRTLESGDRIVAVNNSDVMGRTKLEVARMIQNAGVSSSQKSKRPNFPLNLTLFVCIENGEYSLRKVKLRNRGQQDDRYFAQESQASNGREYVFFYRRCLGSFESHSM